MMYLDMWRSDTFFCTDVKRLSESKKHRQDCVMSSAHLQSVFAIGSALTYLLFSGNVSYHVTQIQQAFPRVSIGSDKHWVRRPGYEAIWRLRSQWKTCNTDSTQNLHSNIKIGKAISCTCTCILHVYWVVTWPLDDRLLWNLLCGMLLTP